MLQQQDEHFLVHVRVQLVREVQIERDHPRDVLALLLVLGALQDVRVDRRVAVLNQVLQQIRSNQEGDQRVGGLVDLHEQRIERSLVQRNPDLLVRR